MNRTCSYKSTLKPLIISIILLSSCFSATADEALSHMRQADHPATSPDNLAVLARDEDAAVRRVVAMNRRTPLKVLEQLAHDSSIDVRIAVCTNLSTRQSTLAILAHDQDARIRSVVARFEYVSAEVLASMKNDKDANIRYEVARNWNTDINTLTLLSKDDFEEVRNMALQSLADRAKK